MRIDIARDSSHDLSQSRVGSLLRGWINSGDVSAVHIHPPFVPWFFRKFKHLSEQINGLARVVSSIIRTSIHRSTPVGLDAACDSGLWTTPSFRSLPPASSRQPIIWTGANKTRPTGHGVLFGWNVNFDGVNEIPASDDVLERRVNETLRVSVPYSKTISQQIANCYANAVNSKRAQQMNTILMR